MKLHSLKVKNYKSLRDLEIKDLGDFTVLIGKNSSGKSNILEAISIGLNMFSPNLEQNVGKIDDEFWFDKRTEDPIEISLTLRLKDEEFDRIFSDEFLKKIDLRTHPLDLTIHRKIIYKAANVTSLITDDIKLNNFSLMDHVIKPPSSGEQKETKQSSESQKIFDAETLNKIIQAISTELEGKFILIQPTRGGDDKTLPLSGRTSLVPKEIQTELTALGQSLKRSEEREWGKIRKKFRTVSPFKKELMIVQNQIYVEEGDIRFPIALIGGGEQQSLDLLYRLKQKGLIFGIEEPEIHCHPQLERESLKLLLEASKENQIIITTHSPILVNRSDLDLTRIVRKDNNETKVENVNNLGELRNVLYEIGIRPSDLLFADKILFVEGWTEKIVLPILARKINVDLDDPRISIIPVRGKNTGKYHLKMWMEITKHAQIPLFILLDKNAEEEAKEIKTKIPSGNIFLLKEGDLEDYYPPRFIKEALESVYKIKVNNEDLKDHPRVKKIEKILKKEGKLQDGWKIVIGKHVASKMSKNDISTELRDAIEKVGIRLK